MNTRDHVEQFLKDDVETVEFGRLIASACENGCVIYLHGDLGAGKTTLSRGVIQGFGHSGNVKSPTYTLVEVYELPNKSIFHFDLYRLADPEELEFMGIRDYFQSDVVCLVEWPEKGGGLLAQADLQINMQYYEEGRKVQLDAESDIGRRILAQLTK